MEKIEQQLEDLNAKFGAIMKRIGAIPEEIVTTEKRITGKGNDLNQVLKDLERAREERQKLLVNGGKVEPVSRKIRELWETCDLIEDEILGLKRKVKDLHEENDKLLVDKDLCQDEIIKVRVGPCIDGINLSFKKAAEELKKLDSIMEEYNLAFAEEKGWMRFVACSNWIGLRIIPRLGRPGDEPGLDFWNTIETTLKKQREDREKAYKLTSTPGPEA